MCCQKSITDLYSFDSPDRHNCLRKFCIQLVKYRFTNANRHSMNHTLDHTACRILLMHTCHKSIFCLCRRFQIRHIQWTLADIAAVCTLWIDHNTGNLLTVRINLNSQCPKHFQCHSTSGNTSDRLPTGGTATTAIISKSIFLIKRIVCVPRAIVGCNLRIIRRPLCFIVYHHGYRRSRCFPLKDT